MNAKKIWLEKGYESFALYGPKYLSINKMAKEIDQARTSFYYYFNDLNDFINELILTHMNFFEIYLERGRKECKRYKPDIHKLLSDFPIGLQFHKQLFNNRNNPLYNFTYMQCNDRAADAFVINLFIEYYELDADKNTIKLIHGSLQDTWFSRLDLNDITIKSMIKLTDEIMDSFLLLLKKSKSPINIG